LGRPLQFEKEIYKMSSPRSPHKKCTCFHFWFRFYCKRGNNSDNVV